MRMSGGFRVSLKANQYSDLPSNHSLVVYENKPPSVSEAYSHTLPKNDLTVNDNNENGYEMKNTAGSRNQRGSAIQTKEEMIG